MPNLPPGFAPHHLGPPPRRGPGPTVQSAPPPPPPPQVTQSVMQMTKPATNVPMNPQQFMPSYTPYMENQTTLPLSVNRTTTNTPTVIPPQHPMNPGFSPVTSEVPTFNRQQPNFVMNSMPQTTNFAPAPQNPAHIGGGFATVSPEVEYQKQNSFPNMYVSNANGYQQQNHNTGSWQEADNARLYSSTTVQNTEIGIYSSNSNKLHSKGMNGQPKKRVGFAPAHEDITLKENEYGDGDNALEEETSSIRYEADRIAQRLMQTEQELDRLKKQGDLIGESLRKQKLMDVDSLQDYYTGRTNLNHADPKLEQHQPSNLFREEFSPTSATGNTPAVTIPAGSSNNTWTEPKPNEMEDSINSMNEELKKTVISDEECQSLGLPKGTMWFDGSAAQMEMIQQQLAESQAQNGDRSPSKSNSATMLSIPRQEAIQHFHQINLSPDNCSQNDLLMTYKRLAPPLHPNVQGSPDKLQHLTDSIRVCEGYLEWQKQGSQASDSKILYAKVEAMTYFDQVFFAQAKHANIKVTVKACFLQQLLRLFDQVNLGVSLEDLLNGHSAVFEFERKAHNIGGEPVQERCQLQVDVVPGMVL